MKGFVPALIELRNAPPDTVISKLYNVFREIVNMNDREVVAAYQAVDAIAEEMNMDSNRLVLRLKEAIRLRMVTLEPERQNDFETILGFPRNTREIFKQTLRRDLNVSFLTDRRMT